MVIHTKKMHFYTNSESTKLWGGAKKTHLNYTLSNLILRVHINDMGSKVHQPFACFFFAYVSLAKYKASGGGGDEWSGGMSKPHHS